jgi:hypothetical protein
MAEMDFRMSEHSTAQSPQAAPGEWLEILKARRPPVTLRF